MAKSKTKRADAILQFYTLNDIEQEIESAKSTLRNNSILLDKYKGLISNKYLPEDIKEELSELYERFKITSDLALQQLKAFEVQLVNLTAPPEEKDKITKIQNNLRKILKREGEYKDLIFYDTKEHGEITEKGIRGIFAKDAKKQKDIEDKISNYLAESSMRASELNDVYGSSQSQDAIGLIGNMHKTLAEGITFGGVGNKSSSGSFENLYGKKEGLPFDKKLKDFTKIEIEALQKELSSKSVPGFTMGMQKLLEQIPFLKDKYQEYQFVKNSPELQTLLAKLKEKGTLSGEEMNSVKELEKQHRSEFGWLREIVDSYTAVSGSMDWLANKLAVPNIFYGNEKALIAKFNKNFAETLEFIKLKSKDAQRIAYNFTKFIDHGDKALDIQAFKRVILNSKGEVRGKDVIDFAFELASKEGINEKLDALEEFWSKGLGVKSIRLYKKIAQDDKLKERFLEIFNNDIELIKKTIDLAAKNKLNVNKDEDWKKITKIVKLQKSLIEKKINSAEELINKLLEKEGVLNKNPKLIDLVLKLAEAPDVSNIILRMYGTDKNSTKLRKSMPDIAKIRDNPKELEKLLVFYDNVLPILLATDNKSKELPRHFQETYLEQRAVILHKIIDTKQLYDYHKALHKKIAEKSEVKKETLYFADNIEFWHKIAADDSTKEKLAALEEKLFDKKHGINNAEKFYKYLGEFPKARELFSKMFSHDFKAIEAAMSRFKPNEIKMLPEQWQKVERLISLEEKMINSSKESKEIINKLLIKKGKFDLSALSACELAVADIEKFKDLIAAAEWKQRSEGALPALTKLVFKQESKDKFIEKFKEDFKDNFKRKSYFDNADFIKELDGAKSMIQIFELSKKEKELKAEQKPASKTPLSMSEIIPGEVSSKLSTKPPTSHETSPSKSMQRGSGISK
jgi:hypothetical protein